MLACEMHRLRVASAAVRTVKFVATGSGANRQAGRDKLCGKIGLDSESPNFSDRWKCSKDMQGGSGLPGRFRV